MQARKNHKLEPASQGVNGCAKNARTKRGLAAEEGILLNYASHSEIHKYYWIPHGVGVTTKTLNFSATAGNYV